MGVEKGLIHLQALPWWGDLLGVTAIVLLTLLPLWLIHRASGR